MFAFAIILWEICHWRIAYSGVHRAEVKDSIERLGIRLDVSKNIPKELKKIIVQSWDQSPVVRPMFEHIFEAVELFDASSFVEIIDGRTSFNQDDEPEPNHHFSMQVNADKLNNLLLSPGVIPLSPEVHIAKPAPVTQDLVLKDNPELARFWNNITADANELSWEYFYDHVSLFLDLDNPNDL